jgi:hypothetical protein
MEVYKPVYPGLYYFDTFTFTSLGTSGSRGPDVTKGYANAPWRDGDFYIQDGQQYLTVPTTGTYQITAAGAYGAAPGRVVSGQVNLNQGQTLQMLIGQQPTSTYAGGGTWIATDKLLIAASGGDGTGGHAASFSPYGSGLGQNGAGYLTDGLQTNPDFGFIRPIAFVNGGFGNRIVDNSAEAGFGGANLVGAGGYTGSPGDGVSGATCYADSTVKNFTDLGATSNSSGYVSFSLINPSPSVISHNIVSTSYLNSVQVDGYNSWTYIAYSPELKIYVASSTSRIVYSFDGQLWNSWNGEYSIYGVNIYCIAWSPKLGVFVAIGQNNVYSSNDGIKWIITNNDAPQFCSDIIWVPFLDKFLVFKQPYIYESLNGVDFNMINTSPTVYAASYNTKKFAASSSVVIVGTSAGIYTSNDGVQWDLTLTTADGIKSVVYGNGVFFVAATTYYYYSTDGYAWSNGSILPYTPYGGTNKQMAIFTNKSIIVTCIIETLVSYDYIHWTAYPNNLFNPSLMDPTNDYTIGIYNSENDYIVAMSPSDINLTTDGTIWIKPPSLFITGQYDKYACSETGCIVMTYSSVYSSVTGGIYSKDSVIWRRIPGFETFADVCIWNPIQGLFQLSDTILFDPLNEILVQTTPTPWLDPKLFQWYYDQGLNNNGSYRFAFSLSGTIVDLGPYDPHSLDVSVSCSGNYFIKSVESPINTILKSTDGISWEEYPLVLKDFEYIRFYPNKMIYVAKYKAFFSLGSVTGPIYGNVIRFGIFMSYDGIEWTCLYILNTVENLISYDGILWNNETNAIIIFEGHPNGFISPVYIKIIDDV